MLKQWLSRAEPIGCHVAAGRVRLAQVQPSSPEGPRIVAAERPLPEAPADAAAAYDPAAVGALLRDMIRSSPFRGSRVVSCPPPGAARYATMRLAPMPAAELAHAAHWKLATDLGIATAEFKSAVLNVVEVRDAGKQKTEALVVSATLSNLDRHVEAVAAAGLELVAIDDPACAVCRSTGVAIDGTGAAATADPRVVLDLRDEEAFLAIATGSELSFVRPVGPGLSQLNKTLAQLLEVAPADAIDLQVRVLAAARVSGGGDDGSRPANWTSAVPFQRAREAVADASRMYGRELARQVALATYYYSTAATAAAPATGIVVSGRTIDPAVLEVVTVQSGIDLATFNPAGRTGWTSLLTADSGCDPSTWATAVGLSMYELGQSIAQEAA